MDTLLSYLKTLKVVSQKRKDGSYYVVYAPGALRRGLISIKPEPTEKEKIEAVNWLVKNCLALPLQDGLLNKLIKIE